MTASEERKALQRNHSRTKLKRRDNARQPTQPSTANGGRRIQSKLADRRFSRRPRQTPGRRQSRPPPLPDSSAEARLLTRAGKSPSEQHVTEQRSSWQLSPGPGTSGWPGSPATGRRPRSSRAAGNKQRRQKSNESEHVLGPYGKSARTWQPRFWDKGRFARATDGQPAIRYEV